jgi:pentatricopeptide repeat protein
MDKMESLYESMEGSVAKPDISTLNTLISVYAQGGYIEKAEEVFNSLESKGLTPDAMSWTSLMGAYAKRSLLVVFLIELLLKFCFLLVVVQSRQRRSQT